MKKLIFIILFLVVFTLSVSAESTYKGQYDASGAKEIYDLLPEDARKTIDELEIDISNPDWTSKITTEGVFTQIWDFIKQGSKTPLRAGGGMVAVIILLAAVSAFDWFKTLEGMTSYIFTAICAAGLLFPMFSMIESCSEAVKGIGTLMTGFVPLYAGILTAAGQAATASGMSFLLLAAAGAVGNLSSFVIVPLMSCYLGVAVAATVMPMSGTNRLGEGIKKTAMWILSLALTLFLGLLSIQTAVNKAGDNLGLKAARFMIGSFVPVAGGALSETLTTLIGSVKLLKSSVGMFGVLGIAVTVIPAVLELLIWRIVLFGLDIAAELFGIRAKTDLLRAADSVIAVLIGVMLFTAALFIISLAVVSGG